VIDFAASLTMENDVVTDDHAFADGGSGQPGGIARGGGIEVSEHGTLSLTNVTVSENSAAANGGSGGAGGIAFGGGIAALERSTMHTSNVTLSQNFATATGGNGASGGIAEGGGLAVREGSLQVSTLSAVENTATAVGGSGGGVTNGGIARGGGMYAIELETPVLESSTFSGNLADASGGPGTAESAGGSASGGGLELEVEGPPGGKVGALTFNGNVALAGAGASPGAHGGFANGGGAHIESEKTLSVVNSTFVGNAARAPGAPGVEGRAFGGGLAAEGVKELLSIAFDTFDANSVEGPSPSTGGGDFESEGNIVAGDLIVNAGVGPAGRENCIGTIESRGFNLDSRDQCSFHGEGDHVNSDPLLGPLQNNGGPVTTEALKPGSPAIESGSTIECSGPDARGVVRPVGPHCDIGAFEVALPTATSAAATGVFAMGATLNGTFVNPDVLGGTLEFQYGTSTSYGSLAGVGSLAAAPAATPGVLPARPTVPLAATLSGLTPNTTYHFRAVAINPEGTTFGADETFTTPTPLKAPPLVPPHISKLSITPSSLHVEPGKGASTSSSHKKRGATISYTDSQFALAKFTVQAPRKGFRAGKLCTAKPPRHHKGPVKHCTRFVTVGAFTHADKPVAVKLHFTGRVNGKPLQVGRYRLLVVARNPRGESSKPVSAEFRVIP
jgi:hypothetical protein